MQPTVETNCPVDFGKVCVMSDSEPKTHKPFKLRKTFGKKNFVDVMSI